MTNIEWQPIETAPKDDENYIIGRMGVVVQSMCWSPDDEEWYTFNAAWELHCEKHIKHDYAKKGWQPTHWMPLNATTPP